MTKKDYENVGRILRGVPDQYRRDAVVSACQIFAGSNERFDRQRFLRETGYWPCKKQDGLCRMFFATDKEMQEHYRVAHQKVGK